MTSSVTVTVTPPASNPQVKRQFCNVVIWRRKRLDSAAILDLRIGFASLWLKNKYNAGGGLLSQEVECKSSGLPVQDLTINNPTLTL